MATREPAGWFPAAPHLSLVSRQLQHSTQIAGVIGSHPSLYFCLLSFASPHSQQAVVIPLWFGSIHFLLVCCSLPLWLQGWLQMRLWQRTANSGCSGLVVEALGIERQERKARVSKGESHAVLPFLPTFQVGAAVFQDCSFHSGPGLCVQATFASEDEWVWYYHHLPGSAMWCNISLI